MIHKLIILIFLVLFWYAFSGEQGWFYIISGAFSCFVAFYIAVKTDLDSKLIHNHKIITYVPWLLWEVVLSGLYVTKLIFSKESAVSSEFVTLTVSNRKEVFYAMYANSLTMTPGTVTCLIDEKNGHIHVHAVSKELADELRSGGMERKVEKVIA